MWDDHFKLLVCRVGFCSDPITEINLCSQSMVDIKDIRGFCIVETLFLINRAFLNDLITFINYIGIIGGLLLIGKEVHQKKPQLKKV
jgi:hypothetical protein